jgi:hypothetical protein
MKRPIFDSLRDTNKVGYKHFEKRIEIVSDGTYSFTVNILVEIIVDTSAFSYNAYKKYVKDPDCYDRRSEKKIKNGTKLKLRSEFPVITNNTTTLLLLLLFS